MDIKKIIREEVDDFGWVMNINSIDSNDPSTWDGMSLRLTQKEMNKNREVYPSWFNLIQYELRVTDKYKNYPKVIRNRISDNRRYSIQGRKYLNYDTTKIKNQKVLNIINKWVWVDTDVNFIKSLLMNHFYEWVL